LCQPVPATVKKFLSQHKESNVQGAPPQPEAEAQKEFKLRSPDTGGVTYEKISLADGQQAEVRYDTDTGAAATLVGDFSAPGADRGRATFKFLEENRDLFKIKDPSAELAIVRHEQDGLGMEHIFLAQTYRGVKVFGAELAVHHAAEGNIVMVNGHYVPGIDIDVRPDISVGKARSTAEADLGVAGASLPPEPDELVILTEEGKNARLTWKVLVATDTPSVQREVYFIDAKSGEVAAKYSAIQDAKNRRTYTANNSSTLPGTLIISEGGSSADPVAQATHNNAGVTYDYYKNTFGRDSIDGNGAVIKSVVHHVNSDPLYGRNSAFWSGQYLAYGDGDGSRYSSFGVALDVVAHEFTHAVTQYTAGLIYTYQTGALNESFSDVFGVMVDRNDWLIGEDIYTPYIPGDAMRNLQNPPAGGDPAQPAHMDNYVNMTGDNGGVHYNSGIPNKAAYNVAAAIGKEKMEQIWYRTLTYYLIPSSQFVDMRDVCVRAAADLYGETGPEVSAVRNGFAQVGLGNANPFGTLDAVSLAPNGVRAYGWAIDHDTGAPINVHIYVDGSGYATTANLYRGDVGAAYPHFGSLHGYSLDLPANPGSHNVCAYGINAPGTPGSNQLLACQQITVPVNPIGNLDAVSAGAPGLLNLSGWAIDPTPLHR